MINLPENIYKNKKITASADGSIMFYNMDYAEAYRAKSIGAFTESLHKFINASNIIDKSKSKDVRILDICFGLGYNCAVTFEYASRLTSEKKVHIVSLEKDAHLLSLVKNQQILWPITGYEILRQCLGYKPKENHNKRFSMEIYIMDALQAIYELSGKFDAIFFDPFSYSKNPEMWSTEVFTRMKELIAPGGCLVTYACGKKARNNMLDAGLEVETVATARGAFHPGTKCTVADNFQ